MSTESNRKWARVDKRRALAAELLTNWQSGDREAVLKRLGYHGLNAKGDGTGIVRGRLLAAVACVALDHSTVGALKDEPHLQALAAICEAIYRER
jgi:hypothetical protein